MKELFYTEECIADEHRNEQVVAFIEWRNDFYTHRDTDNHYPGFEVVSIKHEWIHNELMNWWDCLTSAVLDEERDAA